jgi:hypothetical protein
MTPLEYFATNPSIDSLRDNWLLLSAETRDTLIAKQDTLTTNHRISPVLLTDGRYGVCCDIKSGMGPGQIYYGIFSILDLDLLDEAERVDTQTFKALLPEPTDTI